MNIVFDRKTLKVVYLFDNTIISSSDNDVLRSICPSGCDNLLIWEINKDISYNPVHLSVRLDKYNNPESLLYKGKLIYTCSEEDKQKSIEKRIKEKSRYLSEVLPKNIVRSLESGIINLWNKSPYTSPEVSRNLKTFDYFFEKKILPVSWWGTFTDAGGYATMNRSFAYRLHNHHILMKPENCLPINQISQWGAYYINKLSSLDLRRCKNPPKIYGFTPHPHPVSKSKKIFYTMMETESLHPAFRDLCNRHSDEVWVPSNHNKNLFLNGGVEKPIYVMPLGVDEVVYKDANILPPKDLRTLPVHGILGKPLSQGINSFKFLSLFGWSYRKGVDALIKSFVKAFNDQDDVTLIMYSHHVGPDKVVQDVRRYASMIRGEKYPQILFINCVTPEAELPSLYRIGNSFIHCSRGEGFSLPQIEAAACGLPVISCNNTGMSEYLTDDNSYIIRNTEKEVCSAEMHWISSFYHGQLFPKLGEDQINQAVGHMHYVVNNYEEAKIKGKRLRDLVFDKYTWRAATERIAKRIRDIYQET